MTTFQFQINGLSTALQAQRLEATLRSLPGVASVKLDRPTGTVTVLGYDVERGHVTFAAQAAGYELASERPSRRRAPLRRWHQRGRLVETTRLLGLQDAPA